MISLALSAHQLQKLQKAASAAHTYFIANPSHLEMRNNIEKYRRMEGVTEEAFQDREMENEKHWVRPQSDDFVRSGALSPLTAEPMVLLEVWPDTSEVKEILSMMRNVVDRP